MYLVDSVSIYSFSPVLPIFFPYTSPVCLFAVSIVYWYLGSTVVQVASAVTAREVCIITTPLSSPSYTSRESAPLLLVP